MSIWSRSESLLRNLFRRNKVERHLDEELQAYVALTMDEKITRGVPAEEARREALIELGGVTQVKQAVRESRAGSDLESVGQDIRFGWHMLKRSPSFTLAAVISLGLGMGATTAIFSAVYSLLIRPLAYPNAQRLVWISNFWPKVHMDTILSPDFVEARSQTRAAAICAYVLFSNPGQLAHCRQLTRPRQLSTQMSPGVKSSSRQPAAPVPRPGLRGSP